MHNKIWTHFAKVILLLSAQIIFNSFSPEILHTVHLPCKNIHYFFHCTTNGYSTIQEKKNQTIHLIVYDVYEIKAML